MKVEMGKRLFDILVCPYDKEKMRLKLQKRMREESNGKF